MLSDHPRIVVCTFNLWRDPCWPAREEALRAFLQATQPDILAVQELHPVTRRVLDEELKDHQRIEDSFPGWEYESNVYWNGSFFSMFAYGAQDIEIVELQCRLFWVKLMLNGNRDKSFVLNETRTFAPASPDLLCISYVSSENTHMGQKVFDMSTFSIIVYHRRYHVIPMNRDKTASKPSDVY